MTKIRILLADDHPLIRAGFSSLLGKSDRFEIVGEAENGSELLALASTLRPDIILTDISMPLTSGLDALEQLSDLHPEIKSIVLTMHEEREYVLRALKIGASGYLLKI
jgi:DNA-binding NarL/FixJ family response regulator